MCSAQSTHVLSGYNPSSVVLCVACGGACVATCVTHTHHTHTHTHGMCMCLRSDMRCCMSEPFVLALQFKRSHVLHDNVPLLQNTKAAIDDIEQRAAGNCVIAVLNDNADDTLL